jgi:hypothetical protein
MNRLNWPEHSQVLAPPAALVVAEGPHFLQPADPSWGLYQPTLHLRHCSSDPAPGSLE